MITVKEIYKYGIQTYTKTFTELFELIGQECDIQVGQIFKYDGSSFHILNIQ